jgi:DNA-binding FadR family transcriptional regulator
MKRELTLEEHEEIVRAVAAGDRVKATHIYLSATEGNLTDAQNYVKTLIAEAEAAELQRSSKKSR